MFSATFPRQMEALARRILQRPIEVQVGGRSVVCKGKYLSQKSCAFPANVSNFQNPFLNKPQNSANFFMVIRNISIFINISYF